MLNHYHSDACEGCAGWQSMYEGVLAMLGERNSENRNLELEAARARSDLAVAEVRVDLVTLDHARDRKELREKLVAANAVLDQYRNLVAGVWQTIQSVLEPMQKAYANLETEMRRLAAPPEVQMAEWEAKVKEAEEPSPHRWITREGWDMATRGLFPPELGLEERPPAIIEEPMFEAQYRHAPYGPGPRSGHLSIPPLSRVNLPGMVPESPGERVVRCGEQCRGGHLYRGSCLLTEYRSPEQQQRYPGGGDAQG